MKIIPRIDSGKMCISLVNDQSYIFFSQGKAESSEAETKVTGKDEVKNDYTRRHKRHGDGHGNVFSS